MSKPTTTVSAAEISRLAGVTRATVSNWRRRHADFPKSSGGTESRPTFDLHEVQRWLADHGVEASDSAATELRTLVRARATPEMVALLLEKLRRDGKSWVATDSDIADELVRAVGQAAAEEGAHAALDILAERALEDIAATGVYATPHWLAELMAALAGSPPAMRSVLDPACGSGSLLLAAAQAGAVELYGQDELAVQVQRTRLLLEFDTDAEPDVRAGDSLLADAFPELRADAVLCNPPYGQRDWGAGELAFDPRWDHGLPPRGESELAWVQHALAHLRAGGTAALLLPPAVATRGSGRKIRANLVRTGALRAVIGLAPGIAQPWHVGLQIWVLRRSQPGVPVPDALLFVDTTTVAAAADGAAVSDAVLRAWRAFDGPNPDAATESGVAVAVRLVDVLTEEVDLTPAHYVRSALDSSAVSDQVTDAISQLDSAANELVSTIANLDGWSASPGRSWRFVSIAELANHGQLEWIRSTPPGGEPPGRVQRAILTAPDIANGAPASGTASSAWPETVTDIAAGDVLIPAVRSDRTGGRAARVASAEDAGAIRGPHVHTLRADPDLLDPWFLAGFVTGAENVSATRTSTVRFDPSRLRVPVLPLAEQQRYGEIFRLLFGLRTASRRASQAAEGVAELVTTGLTAGALAPPGTDDAVPEDGQ